MSNWSYTVVELKPDLLGRLKPEAVEELLAKHGRIGWELVNVVYAFGTTGLAFFKKPLG